MTVSVMLVDDNPTFLSIATRFLQQQRGVTVVGVAHGGQEALAQALELRPQVVLLDLAMPDLPGLEVIPCLRAMSPETGIIVLTLLDASGYQQAALAAGADAFIAKAELSARLLPVIRQVAAKRSDELWEEEVK